MKKLWFAWSWMALFALAVNAWAGGEATSGDFIAVACGDFVYTDQYPKGHLIIVGYTGTASTVTIPAILDGKAVMTVRLNTPSAAKTIVIPDGVSAVKCPGVTDFIVAADHRKYCSVDGVIFSKDRKGLVSCPNGKKGKYAIPDGVTIVGLMGLAFSDCSELTDIVIPDSVTEIDGYAFAHCTGLKSLFIPRSVVSWDGCLVPSGYKNVTTHIPMALSGCKNLAEVNIAPDNPKFCSVDGVVFSKDKSVLLYCPPGKQVKYTIPDSVSSIAPYAFADCTGLTEIIIPAGVKTIGAEAFHRAGIKAVAIPDGVTRIEERTFAGCDALTSVQIGAHVETIGDSAFAFCKNLAEVTIPQSVTDVGKDAFSYCERLTHVRFLSPATQYAPDTFWRCPQLDDITLGTGTSTSHRR